MEEKEIENSSNKKRKAVDVKTIVFYHHKMIYAEILLKDYEKYYANKELALVLYATAMGYGDYLLMGLELWKNLDKESQDIWKHYGKQVESLFEYDMNKVFLEMDQPFGTIKTFEENRVNCVQINEDQKTILPIRVSTSMKPSSLRLC